MKFAFDHPDEAIRRLADQLSIVSAENITGDCTGRVTSADILADRDSPAADVSAMDGYAIRLADLETSEDISVEGESVPGAPPPAMPASGVIRIFTGAIVPSGCDAVVKREDTIESAQTIRLSDSAMRTSIGEHIRRAGENAVEGSTVVPRGTLITSAVRATMANFGADNPEVFSRVRVTVLTTGDEVGSFDRVEPKPWQLRNSNQVAVASLLSNKIWIHARPPIHGKDDREKLASTLAEQLKASDAIIMTGGVSMGDYDFVPDIIRDVGGKIIFHGLPIRPGKPILGAATMDGKLILGLPGNPVSATVGCHRFAIPLLARMSGQVNWLSSNPMIYLDNAGDKTIPLHWFRLVRVIDHGKAQPIESKGSGDLVSLGQSSGFVEMPQNAKGAGPWPYHAW